MFKDIEKLNQLKSTFDRNFRLTRLYAAYLERCPDIITPEMVNAVAKDAGISNRSALVGILCELFGVDVDRSAEDRILIRDYLSPSVRIMDPKRYTENPYYKNVKIPSVTDGRWELKTESYKPYRGVIAADMMLLDGFREVAPLGFFEEEFFFPAVLEDGNEWMTLTPVDLDTCDDAIASTRGKVVTFGLGLGYYAYMASEKETVESVTVVEKSADVIRLFKKHILPQFPHKDKIRIVEADAFEYAEKIMPKESFTYAFVDTWRDASDGAPMYERMKRLEHLCPDTEFDYWIESFLISRHRAVLFRDLTDAIDRGDPDAPTDFSELIARLENPLDL